MITLIYVWIPFAALPIYAAMQRIDRGHLEAAADLGAGPWSRFARVTIPLSLPGALAAFFMVFIPTVGEYVTPSLVGGTEGFMYGNIIQDFFTSAATGRSALPVRDHAGRHPRARRCCAAADLTFGGWPYDRGGDPSLSRWSRDRSDPRTPAGDVRRDALPSLPAHRPAVHFLVQREHGPCLSVQRLRPSIGTGESSPMRSCSRRRELADRGSVAATVATFIGFASAWR